MKGYRWGGLTNLGWLTRRGLRGLLCSLTLLLPLSVLRADTLINSFETNSDIGSTKLRRSQVTLSFVNTYVTNGAAALKIVSSVVAQGSYPMVGMYTGSMSDMTATGGYAVDVSNPTTAPVAFSLALIDANGATWNRDLTIDANTTVTYRFGSELAVDPITLGLRSAPNPYPTMMNVQLTSYSQLAVNRISELRVFFRDGSTSHTLILDNFRALTYFSLSGLLSGMTDAYGQYNYGQWAGKVVSGGGVAGGVAGGRGLPIGGVKLSPGKFKYYGEKFSPKGGVWGSGGTVLDQYLGWATGPQLTATGAFYTTKYQGKWWLVDPLGRLFWSIGIASVDLDNWTMVTGRESYFTSLPPNSGDTAQFWTYYSGVYKGPVSQGYAFNFYTYNLYKKYGSSYASAWTSNTVSRLKSWGFNTAGNWSESVYGAGNLPYTADGWTGGSYKTISAGWTDSKRVLPDVYDPNYAVAVDTDMNSMTHQYKNDPCLIGYFVDNEQGWIGTGTYANYGLALNVCKKDASSQPAKAAFVALLQNEYGAIGNLNTAWNSSFASWSAVSSSFTMAATPNQAQLGDMSAFQLAFARQYFNLVKSAIRRYDPVHLYLGCRFQVGVYSQEALQACSEYADVMSYNWYAAKPDANQVRTFDAIDRPYLVGEFHFASTTVGDFWPGLVQVPDEPTRGRQYAVYMSALANAHSCVGAHWYKYVDEPTTGDAYACEDGSIGLVDIVDNIHPELVAAAGKLNSLIYGMHFSTP